MKIDLSEYTDLFPKVYRPHLFSEKRFLILYGGAGSGKSFAAALKVLYRLITEPGITICVIRKTSKSIRQSCFALLKNIISDTCLGALFVASKTDMSIECINGSKIITTGLDDVEKVKSIVSDSIWIEEASEISLSDFEQLNLRLRGTKYNKEIILTFNPISVHHWLKRYFFDTDNKEEIEIVKTTYKDNPYLDHTYIKQLEALKDSNENMYKIYGCGEWGTNTEDLVYQNNVRYERLENINEVKDIFMALDFGYNDQCSLIRHVLGDNNKIYLEEIIYQSYLSVTDMINLMKEKNVMNDVIIYADSARPDLIAELKQAGFFIRGAKKGKIVDGIQIVKGYTLCTHTGNPNINMELQNYKWKKVDGVLTDYPVDMYNHAMDAIRYGITNHLVSQNSIQVLKGM